VKGLQDKVALVTGGSSGIGQAIAIRLGDEGANVAINFAGRPEGAISTREAIEHGVEVCMKKVTEAGGRPILVAADVSDEQAVEQMFDRARRVRAGPDRIRLASPPTRSGDRVRNTSSSRPAAASCPFGVGAALGKHLGKSPLCQRAERDRQVHIPLPGNNHFGHVRGLLRSPVGASATVITIGGAVAAVKNSEFQSSRQERDTTATGSPSGP